MRELPCCKGKLLLPPGAKKAVIRVIGAESESVRVLAMGQWEWQQK